MDPKQHIDWSQGTWTNPPADSHTESGDLLVDAVEGSDAWRVTSYGFVHDSEHALLTPMSEQRAVEVVFHADFQAQFDQAGVFVRFGPEQWIKAGCEFSDGVLQLGAVVTNGMSDWSVAPVDWLGRKVRIRVSWAGDALTVRAGLDGDELRLVRVAPIVPRGPVEAGPFCCAPTREGLRVRFTEWSAGPADASLHP